MSCSFGNISFIISNSLLTAIVIESLVIAEIAVVEVILQSQGHVHIFPYKTYNNNNNNNNNNDNVDLG